MFIDGDQGFRDDIEAVLLQKGALHVNVNLHHDARGVLPRPWQPATERQYQTLVETIPAITYIHRIGVTAAIVYVSPQVETLLGWKPEDYVSHPEHWLTLVHPDDQERVQDAMSQAVATHEPFSAEYRVVARDGRTVWLRDMAVMVEDPTDGAQLWQGVQFDITAEKAAETQLQHLAFYDSLTGLPNRRLCIDRLESVLSQPGRPEVALLFLDLDRFKVINDGIGHAAGDELLVAVAQRLTPHVAGRGSLARFGGDEFVAVLEGFAHPREVEQVAEKLLSALRRPFSAKGYDLVVGGTIGIAIASPDLRTPKDLLRAADVALYRAKAAGGGVFAVFDPGVDRQGLERLEQEADLRRALERGEFHIAYQPIVDIASRSILAVEALLRWDHPERGLLHPSEFIPLADETGLIVPLGRWVIEEACRQVSHWQDIYPAARSLQVSVNLSARQFRQDDLENDVAEALGKSGLAPERLALELKEGDALANSVRRRGDARRAEAIRGQGHDRRLWEGVGRPRLADPLPGRRPENRRLMRLQDRTRPARRRHRAGAGRYGESDWPGRHGGSRRNGGAAGRAARAGVRPRAGTPSRAAAHGRRARTPLAGAKRIRDHIEPRPTE